MEYLSKYLQRSFANSKIIIIRWKLLLSSESIRKTKFFPDHCFRKSLRSSPRKETFPSIHFFFTHLIFFTLRTLSTFVDTHTHTNYLQQPRQWLLEFFYRSSHRVEAKRFLVCSNKENDINKGGAPDKQICIQLSRNLSGVINFIPAADKSIGIAGILIYTSLPPRNDPLSLESKADFHHLSPLPFDTLLTRLSFVILFSFSFETKLLKTLDSFFFFLLN